MKKVLTLTLVVMSLVALASCGSTQGHCDAYGSVDNVENTDLASK